MPDQAIAVPVGLTTEGLLAKRYMARLMDGMLLSILAFIASMGGSRLLPDSIAGVAGTLALLVLIALFWIGYGAVLESSPMQATIGKRVMGLKVYNADGGRLALSQAAFRNLVKDGPFLLFGLLPGVQLLSVVWLAAHLVVLHRSPVSQAIHDRAARTWVAAPEHTVQLRLSN
ncbi:MAG TPA: RDD family protein [Verrucomicrobiae bacterium]|nr:RDD family protein [Verrucomicrobiae bacterium]